jgi:hypothetical protein
VKSFNSTIKDIHLALEVKIFFGNSAPVTGLSTEFSPKNLEFPLIAVNDIVGRGRERENIYTTVKSKT